MVRAVLLTHGTLGASLMSSVESILGPQEEVIVLSNSGKSLDQIMNLLTPIVQGVPCLVFVDFCGGSPFMACKMLALTPDTINLISGVNLPMLLSFFTKRNKLKFSELAHTVSEDGHRGIQLHCE
jgi:mannose PTS system EIIA component